MYSASRDQMLDISFLKKKSFAAILIKSKSVAASLLFSTGIYSHVSDNILVGLYIKLLYLLYFAVF